MAQEVLPFDVFLGDQQAVMTEKTTLFGVIENPISAGTALSVKGTQGQVIVNVFPSDSNGDVATGVQPHILLFDASSSKALSANMQGTAVTPGWYATNVVCGGKTARVLFQVK